MNDSIASARQRLSLAYHPRAFEEACHRLAVALGQYLQMAIEEPAPSLAWQPPQAMVAYARAELEREPMLAPNATAGAFADSFEQLAKTMLAGSHRLHSPHYMGHQVPGPIPSAGLFDCLGTVTNQVMNIYEMGPFAAAVERAMADKLGALIGWRAGEFDAIATHGGSLANLTAILAARNIHCPDSWEKGLGNSGGMANRRPAIVAGADSHYSIARAAGIVGLGTDQVIKAPLDDKRRLDPNQLERVLDDAKKRGLDVFCLCASTCSTPVGAFDPIDDLAEIAARRKLWLHVDGAHGASALLSRRHRHLLRGIERADSITWDAHKMLYMPALSTLLFYRRRADSYQPFRQDAPYIFDPLAPGQAEFDAALRTLECTKRSIMLGLWGTWRLFGPTLFEDLIDVSFDLGRQFVDVIRATDDFIVLNEPECNIVCFRHIPSALRKAALQAVSDFQQSLRRRVVESGEFYLTSARIDGVMALRITLINPLTERRHLEGLLDSLRRHGAELTKTLG